MYHVKFSFPDSEMWVAKGEKGGTLREESAHVFFTMESAISSALVIARTTIWRMLDAQFCIQVVDVHFGDVLFEVKFNKDLQQG